jgi:hypothetical protein
MRRNTVLLMAVWFALTLALAGWVQALPPAPPPASSSDKVYNVLDPRGIQAPVQLFALAPRLPAGPFAGKKILFEQGEADPILMPAIWDRLQADPLFAGVTWYKEVSSSFGPSSVETQYRSGATKVDAIIHGNTW